VTVEASPATWIVPSVSPPAHLTVQRSVKALLMKKLRGGARFVQAAGSST